MFVIAANLIKMFKSQHFLKMIKSLSLSVRKKLAAEALRIVYQYSLGVLEAAIKSNKIVP